MTNDELTARWGAALRGIKEAQQTVLERIDTFGVSAQWFEVLHILLSAPETRMPMSKLARDLSMTSGGFTKLADRMARDGLIDRRGSSGDRRVIYAALTDRGRQTAWRAVGEYQKGLRTLILGVISESDITALSDIAQALHDAYGRKRPDAAIFETTARDPASPERRGGVTTVTTLNQAPDT